MNIEIKVGEYERTIRNIKALPGLMAYRVQGDGLAASSRVVRNEARVLVPVVTGALQRSLRSRRRRQTVETYRGRVKVPGAAARTYAGGEGARHAFLVEYGGETNRAPHPYLFPALISTKSQQIASAGAAMQRSWAKISAGNINQVLRRLATR